MKTSFLIAVIILQSLHAAFSIPLDTTSMDLDKRAECKDNRDDCDWITRNHYDVAKYCHAHREDNFIKDCPRFCGFCNYRQPAPPVQAECKDNRNDCDWITRNHYDVAKYCNAHRGDDFIKDCPRFCGFCNSRQPVQVVCHDTRNDCSRVIARYSHDVRDYCHRHRNEPFIQQCQGTCGFCRAPAPAWHCVDVRHDCWWIGKHHSDVAAYCDKHKDNNFIKQCQRTCGYCKATAPHWGAGCVDLRNDCSRIAQYSHDVEGYCHTHRSIALIQQCPRTCGFCKAPAPALGCEDTRSDCDTINHIGEPKASYCARLRMDPAVSQCPKTCGFC